MTDTHTHPYLTEFEDGGLDVVKRALESGVKHLIFPNVDLDSIAPMLKLHRAFPQATSVAMGLHPTEVGKDWSEIVDKMEGLLDGGDYVAIGEVGIDLYWDKTYRNQQIDAFRRQVGLAERHRLPVIIHCREGLEEVLEVIEAIRPTVPLIFHSFTGSEADVMRIREICDPMFGINGVVTYKSAGSLREALPEIGIERILLETDAPYLSPVPHRGKRNEPSYLSAVCQKIAEEMGLSPEEVERATDKNARRVFGI